MSQLQSVQIQRFKAIEDAPFDVGALNVLVGANNAGKAALSKVFISALAFCKQSS